MIVAQTPGLGRILSQWTPDPGLVFALATTAAVYLLGVRHARRAWPMTRTVSFLAGLGVVAIALLSGVDSYADLLLSVHMVQHMLLLMVAPPLLAYGAPVSLAFAASRREVRRTLAAALSSRPVRMALRPGVASGVVCGLLLGTYFTGLLALTLRDQTIHELEHVAFLLAGLALFVPLVAADPVPRPPTALARLGALTAAMTAMVVVGAVLSFQGSVRYSHYLATGHAMRISALADQQLAGVVMWFGGGLLGGLLTVVIVARALFAEERRQQRRDRYAAGGRVPESEGVLP